MMVSADLSLCSPRFETSTPSMRTLPSEASMMRNRLRVRLLLPAPVLPMMPTCEKKNAGLSSLSFHSNRSHLLLRLNDE